jgi:hypothetical protein
VPADGGEELQRRREAMPPRTASTYSLTGIIDPREVVADRIARRRDGWRSDGRAGGNRLRLRYACRLGPVVEDVVWAKLRTPRVGDDIASMRLFL